MNIDLPEGIVLINGNNGHGMFSRHGIPLDDIFVNRTYKIRRIKKQNEQVVLANTQMNHGLDEEELAASGIKKRISNILKINSSYIYLNNFFIFYLIYIYNNNNLN